MTVFCRAVRRQYPAAVQAPSRGLEIDLPSDQEPSTADPPAFHLAVPADGSRLRELRHHLASWLDHVPLSAEQRFDMLFAVHEAAANAIEHAMSDGEIEVHAYTIGNTLHLRVRDNGHWRPPPSPRIDERGRGLALIGALVDCMEIDPDRNGTTIRMSQRLAR